MYDLAELERDEAASDLPGYIMEENLLHVRVSLLKANKKGLGDGFWKRVAEEIEKSGGQMSNIVDKTPLVPVIHKSEFDDVA